MKRRKGGEEEGKIKTPSTERRIRAKGGETMRIVEV
jgi:hypothetical protein